MAISFETSSEDAALIEQIAARALEDQVGDTPTLDFMMDITAAHLNGCPLDLVGLLEAPDFDFAHDVFGIQSHLNRSTGKLERCFLPRHATK
ncbi:MAG TPA: hypothetical protein ENH62_17540 [Marinobacter sp.]|uniref:DUF6874 domain-containing protein n=1 Tax=marine sediment metagenome TaxID=412755 RepID=A0A0F9RKS3_9ZZZZ|nr:hypothetical protein [Marinobacter sp.]